MCRIALFLLSTGCRLNEALSATWADVDIERRVFTIRATNSKSRKLRSVPLNDSAIEVLNSLDTREDGGPLFVSSRGRKRHARSRSPRSPSSGIGSARLAGLPHLRLHDLRHQFASFLVNDGRTLYEVQAILGHCTSKVTERYAHLSTTTLQEASVERVGEAHGQCSEVADVGRNVRLAVITNRGLAPSARALAFSLPSIFFSFSRHGRTALQVTMFPDAAPAVWRDAIAMKR